MGPGTAHLPRIPYRVSQPGHRAHRRIVHQIERDDFVLALLQPDARTEQRLLRPDIPVAPEIPAVDPDIAFPPATHIEECVAGLRQRKRRAEERWPARRPP